MGAQWALRSIVRVAIALVGSSRLTGVGGPALPVGMRPRPCNITGSPLVVRNGGGNWHSLAGAGKSCGKSDGRARIDHQAKHSVAELVPPRPGAHHHAIRPERFPERGHAEALEVLGRRGGGELPQQLVLARRARSSGGFGTATGCTGRLSRSLLGGGVR